MEATCRGPTRSNGTEFCNQLYEHNVLTFGSLMNDGACHTACTLHVSVALPPPPNLFFFIIIYQLLHIFSTFSEL